MIKPRCRRQRDVLRNEKGEILLLTLSRHLSVAFSRIIVTCYLLPYYVTSVYVVPSVTLVRRWRRVVEYRHTRWVGLSLSRSTPRKFQIITLSSKNQWVSDRAVSTYRIVKGQGFVSPDC